MAKKMTICYHCHARDQSFSASLSQIQEVHAQHNSISVQPHRLHRLLHWQWQQCPVDGWNHSPIALSSSASVITSRIRFLREAYFSKRSFSKAGQASADLPAQPVKRTAKTAQPGWAEKTDLTFFCVNESADIMDTLAAGWPSY